MRAIAPLSALLLLALTTPAARADDGLREAWRDFWARVRAEGRIESRMALGEVRGWIAAPPAAPDWTPRRHGKGSLERGPGGVPILRLEGTPEEMGEQHGALLKDEIRALLGWYIHSFIGPRDLEAAKARAAELFGAHLSDPERRELEALARASGLSFEDVAFGQRFTDLYRIFGCSTLAAPSPEGTLLARNLDFPSMGRLGRYSIVVVARPEGRRPFVAIGWPGLIGVLSGQSEALALSVMVVHNADGARAGVPFMLAFRRALETAADVGEAEALLRATPLTVTNNLMMVDRAGDARVLELHPDGIVARRPDADGRLVATNHFVSQERREPRLSFEFVSSLQRYRAVCDVVDERGPVTVARAREALDAASVPLTLQSMVFLPAAGAIELCLPERGRATRGEWVRLENLLAE
jgi:hypothetical protein